MAHYQLNHLDLSTRMELALRMLDPQRGWGEATRLARSYGTSRKFLYELRQRTAGALQASLEPQAPGPKGSAAWLYVDRPFVQRAILTLSLLPPSLRNLQLALKLLLGQQCSLGYLQHTLKRAGERAQAENQGLQPARPVLGEVDEIFKAHRPCLSVLDAPSMLVLHLAHQADCDRTTWGVTLLDLEQRGIHFADLALDGSQNIRAGIRDAQLDCPLRPDLFHLFHEGRQIAHKLQGDMQRAGIQLQRAQKAAQEVQCGKRGPGRPPNPPSLSLAQAQAAAQQAQRQSEVWDWLFEELQQALRWVDRRGGLKEPQTVRQDLELIVAWMQTFPPALGGGFARNLTALLDELLAPLQACVERLAPWRHNLEAQWEAFILWAWRHRQALNVQLEQDFPPALRPVAQAFWEALADLHRTSSLVEGLHSWLRPFLELHRGMPDWLLALLQAFWNQHPFQRGKRQGYSPMALAQAGPVIPLNTWLDQLLSAPAPVRQPTRSAAMAPEKCYPIFLVAEAPRFHFYPSKLFLNNVDGISAAIHIIQEHRDRIIAPPNAPFLGGDIMRPCASYPQVFYYWPFQSFAC